MAGFTCKPNEWSTHIWVGLVHKGVEHLHRLPDTHTGATAALEIDTSLDVEGDGLFFCGRHMKQK